MTTYNATRIIIPIKGRIGSKSRLSPVMDPLQRQALAFAMADHVLRICAQTSLRVLVVTACPSARGLALRYGVECINDALEAGTSAAYGQALRQVGPENPKLLVNADLPLLEPSDIEAMVEVPGAIAIAPDRKKTGTNALFIPGRLHFPMQFGVDSFAHHKRYAAGAGTGYRIVERETLATDIDEPEDLGMVPHQMAVPLAAEQRT